VLRDPADRTRPFSRAVERLCPVEQPL
jgi:hypothetical protein